MIHSRLCFSRLFHPARFRKTSKPTASSHFGKTRPIMSPYTLIPAYTQLASLRSLSKPSLPRITHLCLCFGFLLQIIYTYRPFFLLTLLHPSHSFFTELRTFMPRVCGAVCSRRPLKRNVRSLRGEGRESALQAQVGVWMCVWIERVRRAGRAKSMRRRGRRSERGSIVAVGMWTGLRR
jgi:hypothetical protein